MASYNTMLQFSIYTCSFRNVRDGLNTDYIFLVSDKTSGKFRLQAFHAGQN